MKGLCYVLLGLALLMFFNKDPLFCVVIVGSFVGVYIFIKRKKKSSKGYRPTTFFSGNVSYTQERSMDKAFMLLALQMLSNNTKPDDSRYINRGSTENGRAFTEEQQDILSLLEEDS